MIAKGILTVSMILAAAVAAPPTVPRATIGYQDTLANVFALRSQVRSCVIQMKTQSARATRSYSDAQVKYSRAHDSFDAYLQNLSAAVETGSVPYGMIDGALSTADAMASFLASCGTPPGTRGVSMDPRSVTVQFLLGACERFRPMPPKVRQRHAATIVRELQWNSWERVRFQ